MYSSGSVAVCMLAIAASEQRFSFSVSLLLETSVSRSVPARHRVRQRYILHTHALITGLSRARTHQNSDLLPFGVRTSLGTHTSADSARFRGDSFCKVGLDILSISYPLLVSKFSRAC